MAGAPKYMMDREGLHRVTDAREETRTTEPGAGVADVQRVLDKIARGEATSVFAAIFAKLSYEEQVGLINHGRQFRRKAEAIRRGRSAATQVA